VHQRGARGSFAIHSCLSPYAGNMTPAYIYPQIINSRGGTDRCRNVARRLRNFFSVDLSILCSVFVRMTACWFLVRNVRFCCAGWTVYRLSGALRMWMSWDGHAALMSRLFRIHTLDSCGPKFWSVVRQMDMSPTPKVFFEDLPGDRHPLFLALLKPEQFTVCFDCPSVPLNGD